MSENKKPDQLVGMFARYAYVLALVPAAVFAGYAVGYGLDYLFSTRYLRFVFLALGVVSGFVQLIRDLNRDVK